MTKLSNEEQFRRRNEIEAILEKYGVVADVDYDKIAEEIMDGETKVKNLANVPVMLSLPLAVQIVEKYLNENFWIDHVFENGYPIKVMAKSDFLGMLNEIKRSIANGNEA